MEKDHAGVYIPPPVIYVGIYFFAFFLQWILPINNSLMEKDATKFIGIIFFLTGIYLALRGVKRFIQTGNTLVTMKPATSLQIEGIYTFTRNPMYFGLACLYLGFTCFFGNWWNIILFPILIIVIQEYVIKREEKYLEQKFGEDYKRYRENVRRWV
jgi:protein-S-isoprenylcysteine O-methyltransferase Ste14